MDNEKIQALIEKLKEFGLDDEKILDVFFEVFKAGKMSKEDLGTLAESMGYELDEEFDKEEVPEGDGKISKEEAEDLKEIKPEESKEEFKEKVEEAKEDDVDEKAEWDEARKLFKL